MGHPLSMGTGETGSPRDPQATMQADWQWILSVLRMCQDRALTGTTDWVPAAVVLDVPAAASRIYYGVLLRGSGAVRSTAIEFGPVDSSVPVTRRFAVPAWALSGPGADACEVRVEPGEPPAGRRVCAISSTGDLDGRAVTLAQFVTTPS